MNGDSYNDRDGGRHHSSRYRDDRRERGDRDRGDRGDRGDRDRDRRRRSRSPHRSSRRDYEVDTYSSSRDYRERERENTYARRERREDRGWERDSRPRRDPRRDDDDRHSRHNRDPFEDRGGRGRRDRDGFGGRERKRSATPPPKKREPTPDLTNVASVLERKRRMTQWDIKPPGYDNATAEQAKLSGMFPLPGAPRQQPMDPSRLQAFMNQPSGSASTSALMPSNAKQAKRLLAHNLPSSATNESVQDFFNLQMNGVNVVSAGDPCISAQISNDRTYALLEFKSSEDATFALALDGITMDDSEGIDRAGLSIRRPKDYIVPSSGEEDVHVEGQVSNIVKDGPNKISVTNIPVYLDGEQIQELLISFGQLKAFVLVQDTGTEQSRGIAFCEYISDESTAIAVEGLHGMELGEGHLKVQRASIGITQVAGLDQGVSAMTLLAGTTSDEPADKGRVLQLLNMVTAEELMDSDAYAEILEDVDEECQKYGKIIEIKMPRPAGARINPGVGKIFIKYEASDSAEKALGALAGRKFADRTVVVTHFSEELFDVNAW